MFLEFSWIWTILVWVTKCYFDSFANTRQTSQFFNKHIHWVVVFEIIVCGSAWGVYASYMGIGRIAIRRLFNKKFLCIIFVGRFLTNRSNWSKLLTNMCLLLKCSSCKELLWNYGLIWNNYFNNFVNSNAETHQNNSK